MVRPVEVEYLRCTACNKLRRTLTKLKISDDTSIMVCKKCCSPDFIRIWKLFLDFKQKTTSEIGREPLKLIEEDESKDL